MFFQDGYYGRNKEGGEKEAANVSANTGVAEKKHTQN
jgi:hypothetical protein